MNTALRRFVVLQSALLVCVVAMIALGQAHTFRGRLVYLVPEVIAATVITYRALSPEGPDRPAWVGFAVWATFWVVADTLWAAAALVEVTDDYWLVGRALNVLAYVGASFGVIGFLRALRPIRWHGATDGMVVACSLASFLLSTLYGNEIENAFGGDLPQFMTAVYPTLDIGVLALAGVALGQFAWRPPPLWGLVLTSFVLVVIADASYGYTVLLSGEEGAIWAYPLFPASLSLLACAALMRQPARSEGAQERVPSEWTPSLATLLALGVLTYHGFSGNPVPSAIVVAVLCLVMGLVRTNLLVHDNRILAATRAREALTDGLTGFGNRRRLLADIDARLDDCRAHRSRAVLAFFDLDGLARYNDAFGHMAGDELLVTLTRRLDAAAPWGRVYRMGGDELCVLGDVGVDVRADDLARAQRALHEQEDAVVVTASAGMVVIPDEADNADDALRIADARMYGDKARAREQASIVRRGNRDGRPPTP